MSLIRIFKAQKIKDSTVESSIDLNGEYKITMHFEDFQAHIHGKYILIT